MSRQKAMQNFSDVAQHLTEQNMDDILIMAQTMARIPLFLEKIEKDPNRPLKYEDSPRGMKLPDFIQKEWVDKGYNPNDIDRKMVEAYNPKFHKAIADYEYNNEILPPNLSFKRLRQRKTQKACTRK